MFYHSFSSEMRSRFGEKVYKLSLDGGMTCPTRDGTLGTRGCIFCSGGSGEFSARCDTSVDKQIESAKNCVAFKAKNCKYIAYFQSFTNTYAPVPTLRALFMPIIQRPDIVALSIATRPDCLGADIIKLLSELNSIKPVWIELGLQTIHAETVRYIRRGYELSVYDRAAKELNECGIELITHMIIGLPGESAQMIYDTASYIAHSGAQGIKLQLLHVLRGTDLAKDYLAGNFAALSISEYTELLEGCIRRLPPEMTVHRITGDGAKRELIAPLWSADKKKTLNYILSHFESDGLVQGELFEVRA